MATPGQYHLGDNAVDPVTPGVDTLVVGKLAIIPTLRVQRIDKVYNPIGADPLDGVTYIPTGLTSLTNDFINLTFKQIRSGYLKKTASTAGAAEWVLPTHAAIADPMGMDDARMGVIQLKIFNDASTILTLRENTNMELRTETDIAPTSCATFLLVINEIPGKTVVRRQGAQESIPSGLVAESTSVRYLRPKIDSTIRPPAVIHSVDPSVYNTTSRSVNVTVQDLRMGWIFVNNVAHVSSVYMPPSKDMADLLGVLKKHDVFTVNITNSSDKNDLLILGTPGPAKDGCQFKLPVGDLTMRPQTTKELWFRKLEDTQYEIHYNNNNESLQTTIDKATFTSVTKFNAAVVAHCLDAVAVVPAQYNDTTGIMTIYVGNIRGQYLELPRTTKTFVLNFPPPDDIVGEYTGIVPGHVVYVDIYNTSAFMQTIKSSLGNTVYALNNSIHLAVGSITRVYIRYTTDAGGAAMAIWSRNPLSTETATQPVGTLDLDKLKVSGVGTFEAEVTMEKDVTMEKKLEVRDKTTFKDTVSIDCSSNVVADGAAVTVVGKATVTAQHATDTALTLSHAKGKTEQALHVKVGTSLFADTVGLTGKDNYIDEDLEVKKLLVAKKAVIGSVCVDTVGDTTLATILTAAGVTGGLVTKSATGVVTTTLPAAADLNTALPDIVDGCRFTCILRNTTTESVWLHPSTTVTLRTGDPIRLYTSCILSFVRTNDTAYIVDVVGDMKPDGSSRSVVPPSGYDLPYQIVDTGTNTGMVLITGTLTTTHILKAHIVKTLVGVTETTLPTAAAIDASMPTLEIGDYFSLNFVNQTAEPFSLAESAGVTIGGSPFVQGHSWCRFVLFRKATAKYMVYTTGNTTSRNSSFTSVNRTKPALQTQSIVLDETTTDTGVPRFTHRPATTTVSYNSDSERLPASFLLSSTIEKTSGTDLAEWYLPQGDDMDTTFQGLRNGDHFATMVRNSTIAPIKLQTDGTNAMTIISPHPYLASKRITTLRVIKTAAKAYSVYIDVATPTSMPELVIEDIPAAKSDRIVLDKSTISVMDSGDTDARIKINGSSKKITVYHSGVVIGSELSDKQLTFQTAGTDVSKLDKTSLTIKGIGVDATKSIVANISSMKVTEHTKNIAVTPTNIILTEGTDAKATLAGTSLTLNHDAKNTISASASATSSVELKSNTHTSTYGTTGLVVKVGIVDHVKLDGHIFTLSDGAGSSAKHNPDGSYVNTLNVGNNSSIVGANGIIVNSASITIKKDSATALSLKPYEIKYTKTDATKSLSSTLGVVSDVNTGLQLDNKVIATDVTSSCTLTDESLVFKIDKDTDKSNIKITRTGLDMIDDTTTKTSITKTGVTSNQMKAADSANSSNYVKIRKDLLTVTKAGADVLTLGTDSGLTVYESGTTMRTVLNKTTVATSGILYIVESSTMASVVDGTASHPITGGNYVRIGMNTINLYNNGASVFSVNSAGEVTAAAYNK
ncbi:MAG: hypothetical protein KAG66_11755 [Methylococcales bacterium]|nr:hypothetical protein [Methylococcales bacterium]